MQNLKNDVLYKRGQDFVKLVENKKPHELVKLNLHWHPYKIEHTPFLIATGIKVYGYNSMLIEMGDKTSKVVDIIGTEYIKSVEIFDALDLKNYKYINDKETI